MLVKFVLENDIFNVITAYVPQIELDETCNRYFWEELDEVVKEVPVGDKFFIGKDFNGHVGANMGVYESIHRSFSYWDKNISGNSILDFAISFDIVLTNTWLVRTKHFLDLKTK